MTGRKHCGLVPGRPRQTRLLLLMGVLVSLLEACGKPGDINNPSRSNRSTGEEDATIKTKDQASTPPKGYFVSILNDKLRNIDNVGAAPAAGLTAAGDTPIIFLNFDGASVLKGFSPSQSYLICQNNAVIPPSNLSPSDQGVIVAKVQQDLDKASVMINLTVDKPLSGVFTTINIGGSMEDLGCANTGAVTGLAPLDVGDHNHGDVGFVFENKDQNVNEVAASTSNIVGYTLGFDKGLGQAPLAPVNQKEVDKASLSGLAEIDTIGTLLTEVKDDKTTVNLANAVPVVHQILPESVQIQGFDRLMTVIMLANQAAEAQAKRGGVTLTGNACAGSPFAPANVLKAIMSPQGQATINTLAVIAGIAGFPEVTLAVKAAQHIGGALFGPVLTPQQQQQPAQVQAFQQMVPMLPDLAGMLNLNSNASTALEAATMLTGLNGTAQVVNTSYAGDKRVALLSLLKIAYAQAYAGADI